MFVYDEKKAWTRAVAVSLSLHASLVVPFLVLERHVPQRNSSQRLLVELFGMIADRQTEERAPSPTETRPSPPKPAAHAHKESKAAPSLVANPPLDPDSAVTSDTSRHGLVSPSAIAVPAPGEPDDTAAPGDLQRQQTLQAAEMDIDELRRYLAEVQRKLQANLVYPEEAKKGGYEGTPVVGFTITADGTIGPGSLVIVQSSGYADLDASALQAARASEPFDRPVRELKEVKVGVKFGMRN